MNSSSSPTPVAPNATSAEPMRVDIFSDINCPWCYIGKRRFEQARAQLPFRDQLEVHWHSYILDPDMPAHVEGTEQEYLVQRKGMPAAAIEQMIGQVTDQAKAVGLDYDFDAVKVGSSLTAHRLLQAAASQSPELAGQLKESLMSGHFVEGLDGNDPADLRRMAERAGIPEQLVEQVLADDSAYLPEVQDDLDAARELGIRGVPFFVLGQTYGVSGAQSPEVFVQALTTAWEEHSRTQPRIVPLVQGDGSGEACAPGEVC